MQDGRSAGNWSSRLSIRWILPAAVVIPVFAIALVLIILAYKTGQQSVSDLAGQRISQIHERIESHLNHLMDLPPAINRINLSRLREGVLVIDDPARGRKLVYETLEAFPEISSIVLGSAKGHDVATIRYPGETSYTYAIKDALDGPMRDYVMSP